MASSQPDFHEIDAARLIRAAQKCGLDNYQLVVSDRKLALVINKEGGKPLEVEITIEDNEIKPML